jgi:hypothetical protein
MRYALFHHLADVCDALGQHVDGDGVAVLEGELVGLVADALHLRLDVRQHTDHQAADAVRDAVYRCERGGHDHPIGYFLLRDECGRVGAPDCDGCVTAAWLGLGLDEKERYAD